MFTLDELKNHQEVLQTFLTNNCMCSGMPNEKERVMEAVSVVTSMLVALTLQLENQAISFTP